jgi:hypothetical protein
MSLLVLISGLELTDTRQVHNALFCSIEVLELVGSFPDQLFIVKLAFLSTDFLALGPVHHVYAVLSQESDRLPRAVE